LGALVAHPIKRQFRERIQKEEEEKEENFELMIGYKYPSIASGATYIRSTGRIPDDNEPI
jgi:hypothetical protein